MPDLLFSTTEERSFKTCRLAHAFRYREGFDVTLPNRKLALGTIVHAGLAQWYMTSSKTAALAATMCECDLRWQAILAANEDMDYVKDFATFHNDRELALAMVAGYIDWVTAGHLDDDLEVVAVERSFYVDVGITVPQGRVILPAKLDVLWRRRSTGQLVVGDHKTARSFPSNWAGHQLAEQSGNYQLAVVAEYDERPAEMIYNLLRKVLSSARSKPPYFERRTFRLLPEEMQRRHEQLTAVATERFAEDCPVYASPDNCCGSWKRDWVTPCMLWHQGYTPRESLSASPGYIERDAYERYGEEETEDDTQG